MVIGWRARNVSARRTRSTTSSATRASTTCPRATCSSATSNGCAASRWTRSARSGPRWSRPTRSPTRTTWPSRARVNGRGAPVGSHLGHVLRRRRQIISHCSQAFTLEPGDVIATGTPGGVGAFREPPMLAPGRRRRGRRRSKASAADEHAAARRARVSATSASWSPARSAASVRGRCVPSLREGTPVVAFDKAADRAPPARHHARPRASPASPRQRRHHRSRLGRDGAGRPRHHARHPPGRAPGAGLPRQPAARRTGQCGRAPSTCFEAVKQRRDQIRGLVYTGSMGMFAFSDADPVSGMLEPDAIAASQQPLRRLQAGQRGQRARLLGRKMASPSIGLRPMTVYGPGRDFGMTSTPTKAIAAAIAGGPTRSVSEAPPSSSWPRTSAGRWSWRHAAA